MVLSEAQRCCARLHSLSRRKARQAKVHGAWASANEGLSMRAAPAQLSTAVLYHTPLLCCAGQLCHTAYAQPCLAGVDACA